MMTAARYEELKRLGDVPASEMKEFKELVAWERRSNAAKQAVRTKKQKYTKWPSRKKDHKALY